MNILWVTNIPSPYRVSFFNELGKYSNLTVVFERSTSSERDKSWGEFNSINFKKEILKGMKIGVDKALSIKVISFLKTEKYDEIVVSNPFTPTGLLAIGYMKINKIPYSIVSDGGFPGKGNGLKETIKTLVLKDANIYFSTGNMHDKYYLKYGAKSENIVRYPFSSLRDSDILTNPINKREKEILKSELGMNEKKIVLSIGQFIYRKGFDVLLKSASSLGKYTGVYIIGGYPTEEYLELIKKYGLKNVYFIKFQNKETLSKYFKAADIFVLPTREDIWGLVINEAMAHGLPIITTNRCVAGLELIKDHINGYVIPVNDINMLSTRINEMLENNKLEKMSKNALVSIKDYTIENMVLVTLETFRNNQK